MFAELRSEEKVWKGNGELRRPLVPVGRM